MEGGAPWAGTFQMDLPHALGNLAQSQPVLAADGAAVLLPPARALFT